MSARKTNNVFEVFPSQNDLILTLKKPACTPKTLIQKTLVTPMEAALGNYHPSPERPSNSRLIK